MVTEATVRLVEAPARPGARRPRLRRRDAPPPKPPPACSRTARSPSRAWPPTSYADRPACRAGRRWLFVETGGATPGRGPRARASAIAAGAPTPWTARRHRPGRAARPVAHPRGRRRHARPGCPTAREAWPGWEDCAVPPARLGAVPARLPRPARRARPARHPVRALRRRLHPRPHRLRPADRTTGVGPLPRASPRSWPTSSSRTAARCRGEHGDGQARAELLPADVRATRWSASSTRFKDALGPGRRPQPRHPRPPRPSRREPALRRPAPRAPSTSPSATRTTAATSRPPSAAASASPSAVRTRPSGRRRDVPLLPGDRRGGALHPRPRPAAARDARRARWSRTAGGRRRYGTRSTCACPARAAAATARSASTWPRTRRSSCTTTTRAGCAPAAHYAMGWLPRWLRLGGPVRAACSTPLARIGPLAAPGASGSPGSPASGRSRVLARADVQPVAAAGAGAGRRRAAAAGRALAGHLHRPPLPGWAGGGPGPGGGRTDTGAAPPDAAASAAASPTSPRASSTRARAVVRRTLDRTGPRLRRRHAARRPGTELRRRPRARDLPELLPDDPRAAALAASVRTFAQTWRSRPRLAAAPPGPPGRRPDPLPPARRPRRRGRPQPARTARASTGELTGGCCGLAGNFGFEKGPLRRLGGLRRGAAAARRREADRRHGAPGRRLLLPHPARPAGGASGPGTWRRSWRRGWRPHGGSRARWRPPSRAGAVSADEPAGRARQGTPRRRSRRARAPAARAAGDRACGRLRAGVGVAELARRRLPRCPVTPPP